MISEADHREAVEAALNHERYKRTPVNNFALATSAKSCGVTVDKARWDPAVSAQTAIDYAIRTGSDFVKPMIDSQVPFADLGMDVRFPENDYGSVKDKLVSTAEDIDDLAFFDPKVASECPKFTQVALESLKETAKRLPTDLNICGLSWGPISTAGYLMGTEDMILATMMGEEELVKKLIAKVSGFIRDQHIAMLDAGATLMWMADPTSSEDLISPDMFDEYSFGALKSVIGDVKDYSKETRAYLHVCGNTTDIIPRVTETGCDCFSFDTAVDLAQAKRLAGNKITLMGNIATMEYMLNGTPESIERKCHEMIDIAGQNGGYIIAPGCEIPITTPDANAIALGEAGRSYWVR